MNRLPIVKLFTLLKLRNGLPSIGHIFGHIWPSISRSRQNFYGIAGFSVISDFPAPAKVLAKKILTSKKSQTSHEMAYFDVKGRGEK